MLHIVSSRLPVLILGITFALSFGASAIAESRVVFQASKEDVKKACDDVEGVPVEGAAGGYGCYNKNNGVLVACSDSGTCTGYLPKGAPRTKALGNVLKFGTGLGVAPETKSLGSGDGESSGGGGGGGCGVGCIP